MPALASAAEAFLQAPVNRWTQLDAALLDHAIRPYEALATRLDPKVVAQLVMGGDAPPTPPAAPQAKPVAATPVTPPAATAQPPAQQPQAQTPPPPRDPALAAYPDQ